MQKVMETAENRKATKVFFATLFQDHVATSGIALRTADHRVFFQAEATGLWTELCDAAAGRLHLHGRTDLALAQSIVDGNLVVKASRTLQRAA